MTPQIIILSDAHHQPQAPQTWQRFQTLLSQLESGATVISLGDFFDIWYRPLKEHESDYHELLNSIEQASSRGIIFHFISGNRDFIFTQSDAQALGINLHEEPFFFQEHAQNVCLIHGDTLLTEDINYQRYRKIIRLKSIQQMIRRGPRFFIDLFINKIRKTSSHKKSLTPVDAFPVNLEKADQTFQSANLLVCGHTHVPQVNELPSGTLHVLPAFGDKGEYLTLDEQGQWILDTTLTLK